ncbi:MAG: 30S ribosomal protein S20 [Chloroflexi bacterium]|nr:30S ribosomal protein S20 [Chloroflexota bacterium]
MANIKSAIKRIRVSERKRAQNKPVRTSLKTYVGKAERLIAAGDMDEASIAVGTAISALDKAAEKGVIHENNAARKKSRLMAKYNKASGK